MLAYDDIDQKECNDKLTHLEALQPRAKQRLQELVENNMADHGEVNVEEILPLFRLPQPAFDAVNRMFTALVGNDFNNILRELLAEEDWPYQAPPMGKYPWYFDKPLAGKIRSIAFDTDCDSGARFVVQEIPYSLIVEVFRCEDFFEHIDTNAKTEYVDVHTEMYAKLMNYYSKQAEQPVCVMPKEGDEEGRRKAMRTLINCVTKFLQED